MELHRLLRQMGRCLLGCSGYPLFPCCQPYHFSCDHAASAPYPRLHFPRSLPTMPRPLRGVCSIALRLGGLADPQKKACIAQRATHQTISQRTRTHPIPLCPPLPHERFSSCDRADSSCPSALPAAAAVHPPSHSPAHRHRRRPTPASPHSHPRPNRRRNQS